MRVLIVEDNPIDAEAVTRILRRQLSAQVECVHTAEEGVRRLRLEEFDLALVDYTLPDKNGVELVRQLRLFQVDIPVILITGRGDAQVKELAMGAGLSDYICKDEYLSPVLVRAVRAAVADRRAELAESELHRQESLRRQGEGLIGALQRQLQVLDHRHAAPALHRPDPEGLQQVHQSYLHLLQRWPADGAGSPADQAMFETLLNACIHHQLSSGDLLDLHSATCQHLRQEGWTCPAGISPRTLLLHLSLRLLDVWRQQALHRVT